MPLSSTANFYVREVNEERGLFASRKFECGEKIYQFDYWSQQLMPIHLTNHSCDPNAAFSESGQLIALREIAANEEITYDYLLHPIPASPWNFKCLCQSQNCVGWIEVVSIY